MVDEGLNPRFDVTRNVDGFEPSFDAKCPRLLPHNSRLDRLIDLA